MFLKHPIKLCTSVLLVSILMLSAPVNSDEYQDQWGPDVGTEAPEIDVQNTEGEKQTIDNLRGDSKGLILFFTRTSNW